MGKVSTGHTSLVWPPYLFDDVSDMQQPLLVDHTTMEDAGYHQLTTLHLERHPLKKHVLVFSSSLINHFYD